MKAIHPKIQELKLRSAPINFSGFRQSDSEGPIDFKVTASQTDRTIKGYLSVWGIEDTYGTIFLKGCFSKSISERGPQSESKQKIAHLWMHDVCNPTGQFTVLKEDNYGLYFEAQIDDIDIGNRELKQIRSGTLNQFSVGFDYIWDKTEYDEDLDAVVIKECTLMEGSVVTFGSNAETYAMRSQEQLITDKENLMDETEDFIKQLPRAKQLELRQLIARQISLASSIKPLEQAQRALDLSMIEPKGNMVEIGGYKIDVKQFN